ncbi:MAG: orotidine 5'-phosphate decarboxylase [Anaerolineales bacterium]|nr:orotidine 5'-phosphate decarboxylase [Anaerolineales bacterium]
MSRSASKQINPKVPLLQIAMDYITVPPALAMALKVADEVDIIEIGTPLCKAAGLDAIRSMREICPDKLILADFKTPDVGGLEAKMAFDAGADMMTVIGGAPLATVKSALEEARRQNKEVLMELTGVRDIIARATEWREIGIERMVYHRGWDEQDAARQWDDNDKDTIRQLIDMGFKVTVTGGLNVELLPFFQDLPVSIIICGRSIRETPDPAASAREVRNTIARLWGGGHSAPTSSGSNGTSPLNNTVPMAIRYAVSEMGLMMTVDGRDCPGCDSPKRLCQGTQTAIHCPAGVSAENVVHTIGQFFGQSKAIGRVSGDVFFLDPGQLPGASPHRVIELLTATGHALRQLGCQVDVGAGIAVANQIMSI